MKSFSQQKWTRQSSKICQKNFSFFKVVFMLFVILCVCIHSAGYAWRESNLIETVGMSFQQNAQVLAKCSSPPQQKQDIFQKFHRISLINVFELLMYFLSGCQNKSPLFIGNFVCRYKKINETFYVFRHWMQYTNFYFLFCFLKHQNGLFAFSSQKIIKISINCLELQHTLENFQ